MKSFILQKVADVAVILAMVSFSCDRYRRHFRKIIHTKFRHKPIYWNKTRIVYAQYI